MTCTSAPTRPVFIVLPEATARGIAGMLDRRIVSAREVLQNDDAKLTDDERDNIEVFLACMSSAVEEIDRGLRALSEVQP